MSIMYCHKHDRTYDTDLTLECPVCEMEDCDEDTPDQYEDENERARDTN